jgi:hypothetical protein
MGVARRRSGKPPAATVILCRVKDGETVDFMTPHTRMTRHIFGGAASLGSPMQPAWASPCVLAQLDLSRPRVYAAMESTI